MPHPASASEVHGNHHHQIDVTSAAAGGQRAGTENIPDSPTMSPERPASNRSLRRRKTTTNIGPVQHLTKSQPDPGVAVSNVAAPEVAEQSTGGGGSGVIAGEVQTTTPNIEKLPFAESCSTCQNPTDSNREINYVEEPGTFSMETFVYQLLLHLGYPISLPLIRYFSHNASISNQFMCPSVSFKSLYRTRSCGSFRATSLQLIYFSGTLSVLVLKCALPTDWLELLTTSEVVLLLSVHVIRIIMIAAKYGFMDRADYEVIQRSSDTHQVMDLMTQEMLLGVWEFPDRSTVQREVGCAHLAT